MIRWSLSHVQVRSTRRRLAFDTLEDRAVPASCDALAQPMLTFKDSQPLGSINPSTSSMTPAQIRQAYGTDQIAFGSIVGDGAGQTIAIIDAFDDPAIAADLATFDAKFGLPAPASFTKVNQNGGSSLPLPNKGWATEIALDVEWAHAIAPGASILLVEATSASLSNLNAAVAYARGVAGVSVVSMSYGSGESPTEAIGDSVYVTPTGHQGVTFVASAGDTGGIVSYPAVSPNVVGVGGTRLTLGSGNTYAAETAWSASGGGISLYESQPAYQSGIVSQSTNRRTSPDVALDADPASGVAVCDSFNGGAAPWYQVGGTSFSAPAWAGLFAITNQGRVASGLKTLDGRNDTLPALYKLPATDFHDVTAGSAGGFSAGPGYDLITGRGSPIANLVVADLIGVATPPTPPAIATHLSLTSSAITPGGTILVTIRALDGNNNIVPTFTDTVHFTSTDVAATLPTDYKFTSTDAGSHTFTVTLKTAGTQTVTVSDATNTAIVGASTTATVAPVATAVSFVVSGFPTARVAGQAGTFTVTAIDAAGKAVTSYTGRVHFTSSDPQALLPADFTFLAADKGAHTFVAALATAGTQSITATAGAVTGSETGIVVSPAAASGFKIGIPATITLGVAFDVTLTAIDAYGNVVPNYTGAIRFASTDKSATLPANYTFTAADNGTHTFSVTMRTAGVQTLSIVDTRNPTIRATIYFGLTPAYRELLALLGLI